MWPRIFEKLRYFLTPRHHPRPQGYFPFPYTLRHPFHMAYNLDPKDCCLFSVYLTARRNVFVRFVNKRSAGERKSPGNDVGWASWWKKKLWERGWMCYIPRSFLNTKYYVPILLLLLSIFSSISEFIHNVIF